MSTTEKGIAPDVPRARTLTLTRADMVAVCGGAAVLGSGGGGSYQVARRMLLARADRVRGAGKRDTVDLVPLSAVGEGQWAGVAADMGAPSALFGQSTEYWAPINAFDALGTLCGKTYADFPGLSFVLPVEAGALNVAAPFSVALERQLPVVDGEGAGRSVPTLPLTVYAGHLPLVPNALATDTPPPGPANSVSVEAPDEAAAETVMLGVIGGFGGIAGLALYAATGAQLARNPPVMGTLVDALEIGRRMERLEGDARVHAVLHYLNHERTPQRTAAEVFRGRVVNMMQQQEGLDVGYVVLREPGGAELWIYMQNENIFATRTDSDAPLVVSPDSISYVPLTGDPLDNSDLYNLFSEDPARVPEIAVLAISAVPQVLQCESLLAAWQAERALIGYPGPFVRPWLPSK